MELVISVFIGRLSTTGKVSNNHNGIVIIILFIFESAAMEELFIIDLKAVF